MLIDQIIFLKSLDAFSRVVLSVLCFDCQTGDVSSATLGSPGLVSQQRILSEVVAHFKHRLPKSMTKLEKVNKKESLP